MPSANRAAIGSRAGGDNVWSRVLSRMVIPVSVVDWLKHNLVLVAGMLVICVPTMIFVAQTSWSSEQGGHGPIVLATGIWLLLRHFSDIRPFVCPPRPLYVALWFVPLLVAYFVARVAQIVELEAYFMYALLIIVLYSFVGWKALKTIWFPLFYILFVFSLPQSVIDALTNPMKILLSKVAVSLLYHVGYPVAGAGVTIQVGQYELLVAAACAGLNSIISLSALSLFYVYVRHQANWRYALLLFFLIVPVAMFANLVRIIILILLTYHFGEAAAQGFLHNFAGLVMFSTALLTIFALDSVIEPIWNRVGRTKEDSDRDGMSGATASSG
ncbi:exosortase V [Sphingobium subterraneum]|uniref:Exosortase n=1 Tax=Sphingobium subterraneum TaxID=627688 RepID=A0A841IX64_9SPHN|nr:exosortase V [Sphingobium subterraneum]MBB6123253.1 exosortase [Sphingobium subterraneum]